MDNFLSLKTAVQSSLTKMIRSGSDLYLTSVDKDEMWNLYLDSFPEGTNPIFRNRRVYDCNCCNQFIRNYGAIVSINSDGTLSSIWDDKNIESPFKEVASVLSELVKSFPIQDIFRSETPKLGTDHNKDSQNPDIEWDHFYCEIPKQFVLRKDSIASTKGEFRSTKDVTKRGLDEIDFDAIDTVLELIDQNSLYRGSEHRETLIKFRQMKTEYDQAEFKDNFVWVRSSNYVGRIRNTVIGTLLVDLTEGVDLDKAVRSFESKVAPANYKRPTALVTKGMLDKAQKKVEELGIERSLYRRHASLNDITINNVLFAGQETKIALNVFDELTEDLSKKVKDRSSLSKVEEVPIDRFVSEILPKLDTIEVMVENRHESNFMSLIAPVYADAKNILKWDNNFSWTYNGSLTDSISQKVKNAGGNIDGILRCSLEWFNLDDLDIHVIEPNGNHICYNNKVSRQTSGRLDVDMNISPTTREAVENVVWTDKTAIREGVYEVYIHNYTPRETVDVGFNVEIVCNGITHSFHYDKAVKGNVKVADFSYSKEEGVKIVKAHIPSSESSKTIWGVETGSFHKVSAFLKSPNHWDGNQVGNLHWFFLLEECNNPIPVRGLFNEYLIGSLNEHRKVFEVLGNKLMVNPIDHQLSGVGFSSTKKDYLLCRVSGKFNRTIKIVF